MALKMDHENMGHNKIFIGSGFHYSMTIKYSIGSNESSGMVLTLYVNTTWTVWWISEWMVNIKMNDKCQNEFSFGGGKVNTVPGL